MMKNNRYYKVIVDEDLLKLIEDVNEMMSLGWRPHGGLFMYTYKDRDGYDEHVWYQAMINTFILKEN